MQNSTDGGVTWRLRGPSRITVSIAIDPLDSHTLYAGTYAGAYGVYKSTDDGVTWTAFDNGLTNLAVSELAFDRTGRFLHAATRAGVFSVRVREGAVAYEGDVAPRNAGDGVVNALDVVQIRRFAAGLDTPDPASNEFQRADSSPRATFGDGVIDAADVVQARRYATGLDPLTPAAGPAIAADRDGDGKADAAVYRNGQWWLRQSRSGLPVEQFGLQTTSPFRRP